MRRRPNRLALMALSLSALVGCSTATSVWSLEPARGGSAPARTFVMAPAVEIGALTGNIGQASFDVERAVQSRIIEIVQEVDPLAAVADSSGDTPFLPMARYIDALAPIRATSTEINAAGYAVQHGGTRLLVPTVVQWREMRTDDPIGALTTGHDRVVIALRLMRLDPVGLAGSVTFKNHARLTLNQSTGRLLNGDFRRTVLKLLTP